MAKHIKERLTDTMTRSQVARAQKLSNEYWERYVVPHRHSDQ